MISSLDGLRQIFCTHFSSPFIKWFTIQISYQVTMVRRGKDPSLCRCVISNFPL